MEGRVWEDIGSCEVMSLKSGSLSMVSTSGASALLSYTEIVRGMLIQKE